MSDQQLNQKKGMSSIARAVVAASVEAYLEPFAWDTGGTLDEHAIALGVGGDSWFDPTSLGAHHE